MQTANRVEHTGAPLVSSSNSVFASHSEVEHSGASVVSSSLAVCAPHSEADLQIKADIPDRVDALILGRQVSNCPS